jgi:glycine oxidase
VIAIVGGGLIGASIGWRLAQKHQHVLLFDATNLGGEASMAGAGMLAPASEATTESAWLTLGMESLRLYPGLVEELHAETGLNIDFRICGGLVMDPDEALEVFHRSAGIRVERHANGLFYPDEALVDPAALLRSFRLALLRRGVLHEHRHVSSIEASSYKAVVIAAGAWSGLVSVSYKGEPLQLPSSAPVKGHLIAFQMAEGLLGPFLRKGHSYVLQRSDGLMIAGSTEEHVGFDTTVSLGTCDDLHRRAAELVPELATAEPVRQWIGFRPGPELPDGPIMRRIPNTNVWLAYGHYRNGILLTPITAQRIADEIIAGI